MRRELAERRRAVPPDVARAAARDVAVLLHAAPEFEAARCVALYASLPDELPTGPLLALAHDRNKPTLFPRTTADGRLEFAVAERFEDLRPGRWGVLEPAPERQARSLGPEALVCVPGVAFDRDGNRLGRGRGFYDRTFPPGRSESPRLLGIAYAFQLVAAVPHAPSDRAMDLVVTEREVHRVRGATQRG